MTVMYSIKNNEVTAILQPNQDDFIEEIKNIERKCHNSEKIFFTIRSNVLWSFAFSYDPFYKGTAKCHPNDTFNLEKGKAIAYKRAYLKFLKDKAKKAEIIHKYLFDFFNREVEMYQHILSSISHIYDDLSELTRD